MRVVRIVAFVIGLEIAAMLIGFAVAWVELWLDRRAGHEENYPMAQGGA